MTGYGAAQLETQDISLLVEIRSLNNRFLKASVKLPDPLMFLEPNIARLLQKHLARGSVTCAVHMKYTGAETAYDINTAALDKYAQKLAAVAQAQSGLSVDLAALLQLPGVCQSREFTDAENVRFERDVQALVSQALDNLRAMRLEEGQSLLADLKTQCETIRKNLKAIAALVDNVVANYKDRLQKRADSLLAAAKLEIDQDSLLREVAIFAERCDINEETSRLESHLVQFLENCENHSEEQVGRRLDFLTQEMLREANTMSSKANDAQISQHVVEIKVAIDRLKEQVQNIE